MKTFSRKHSGEGGVVGDLCVHFLGMLLQIFDLLILETVHPSFTQIVTFFQISRV